MTSTTAPIEVGNNLTNEAVASDTVNQAVTGAFLFSANLGGPVLATQLTVSPTLLSVNEATRWLRCHGIPKATRHGVYIALAAGELRLAGITNRVMLIEISDLERFAGERTSAMPSNDDR